MQKDHAGGEKSASRAVKRHSSSVGDRVDSHARSTSRRRSKRPDMEEVAAYLKFFLHQIQILHYDFHEIVQEVERHMRIARVLFDEIFFFLSRHGAPILNYPRDKYIHKHPKDGYDPLYVRGLSHLSVSTDGVIVLVETVLLPPLTHLENILTGLLEDLHVQRGESGSILQISPSALRDINAYMTDILSFVTDHFYKAMAAMYHHLYQSACFDLEDFCEDSTTTHSRRFTSFEYSGSYCSLKSAAKKLLAAVEEAKSSYDGLIAISCRCVRDIERTFKDLKYVGDQRSYMMEVVSSVSTSLRHFTSVGYGCFYHDCQVELIEPLQKMAGGCRFPFTFPKPEKKSLVPQNPPVMVGLHHSFSQRHPLCKCFGPESQMMSQAEDVLHDNPLAVPPQVGVAAVRRTSQSLHSIHPPSWGSPSTGEKSDGDSAPFHNTRFNPNAYCNFTRILERYAAYVEVTTSARSFFPLESSRSSSGVWSRNRNSNSSSKRAIGQPHGGTQPIAPPSERKAKKKKPHSGVVLQDTKRQGLNGKQKEMVKIVVSIRRISSRFVREMAECFLHPGSYVPRCESHR